MFCQFFVCKFLGKSPVVEFECKIFTAETLLEAFFQSALKKNLFRAEIYKKLLDIVECTFCYKKFTGRDIQKRYSAHRFAKMHCGKKVVLLIIEYIVVYGYTRSNKLCDTALYKFLCQLGVFELVADGNTLAGAHKLREICIEGMEWESCHFQGFGSVAFSV